MLIQENAWKTLQYARDVLQRKLHAAPPAGLLTDRVQPMAHGSADTRCDWCGKPVGGDEGYRVAEEAGGRVAAFCRLEHVVPWAIQGPHWRAGTLTDRPGADAGLSACAECGVALADTRVLLVRHRGVQRVGDAFCGVDHLRMWAHAGGRWR